MNLVETAQKIISDNMYLTLGTANPEPWVAPVFYCADTQSALYFISQPSSKHGQHIRANNEVAFAIFDSHQEEGTGNGIQGTGRVELLENTNDIQKGLESYQTTFMPLSAELLSAPNPYRLYKLIPEKMYILDPDADTDARVLVFDSEWKN